MNSKLAARWAATSAMALAVGASGFSLPAGALSFSGDSYQGSFNTTLSYGVSYRVEDPDSEIIGIANGGTAFGVNADDGTQNYDTGIVSNTFKITSELLLESGDYGGFIRGTAFYDYENEDGDREHVDLTDEAKDLVGSDADILDAYLWAYFDLGEMPGQVRVGNQVLSWGESTFIQNSINTINPIDVSRFRVPGAELREALEPVPLIMGSLDTSINTSVSLFYQLRWEKTTIDPPGSYFSSNDFAGEGGSRVQLGFGDAPEGDFLGVGRDPTREADDEGQYGIAFRVFAPGLNDTEFGFYYINYHSRVPVISARTGTSEGLFNAGQIGTVGNTGVAVATEALTNGLTSAVTLGLSLGMTQDQAGNIAQTAIAEGGVGTQTVAAIGNSATDAYARTAKYFTEYPEDIQLFGMSFNTTIGDFAWQGEISHRTDVPLQIDDVEILFAALSPLGRTNDGQLGLIPINTEISGFILRDLTQVQTTLTRLFPRVMGADQLAVVGEVGVTHVHDFPNKSDLRMEGPGTFVSGNEQVAPSAHPGKPAETGDHFADATSWGYRVVGRLEYNNAIGAFNLSPRLAWAQDVSGISPGPGGNFLEGRTALTLGLGVTYLNEWSGDVSYTRYDGADRYNLINDRDFIAFNVKYSF